MTADGAALDEMGPNIVNAVMMSEDGQFCSHRGIDVVEFRALLEEALAGEATRGRLDDHHADGQESLSVAWPLLCQKGHRASAGGLFRRGPVQEADPGGLPQHRGMGARRFMEPRRVRVIISGSASTN